MEDEDTEETVDEEEGADEEVTEEDDDDTEEADEVDVAALVTGPSVSIFLGLSPGTPKSSSSSSSLESEAVWMTIVGRGEVVRVET
jgi:hypothetical protein